MKTSKVLNKICLVSVILGMFFLSSCSTGDKNGINVITREQGSGTRSAFVEVAGILKKDNSGGESDETYEEAVVQNSTEAVITTVVNDKNAIGYISLGSLNDMVKAISISGVEANAENIRNGKYKLQRPFTVVYDENTPSEVIDFLKYIESDAGQKIVENMGYVSNPKGLSYEALNSNQRITIAGSTSVAPLMEKLVENYKKYNPNFKADIQSTGSSSGIKSVQEGAAELGMVSRELKETEENLKKLVIAKDGIVIIVNKNAPIENLDLIEVEDIFEGNLTSWEWDNEQ